MTRLQDLLRQNAERAGNPNAALAAHIPDTSNIVSGLEGAPSPIDTPLPNTVVDQPKKEQHHGLAAAADHVYEVIKHFSMLVRGDGTPIKQVDGFFYLSSEDNHLAEVHVERGHLVEVPPVAPITE